MPSSPRKIPLTTLPYFHKRATKLFHHCVVFSVIFRTNGWMNPSWVSYPFSLIEEKVAIHFNYNTFLAENIHDQLFKFTTEGMFRYSSILAYMFTFFQADRLVFPMQKMDQDDKPQAVTSWTSLLRRNSTEFNFKQFIEQFYHPVVSMLSGRPEPRVNEEVQRILHLSDLAKTGDWYLYQNHTEIRVYGCELAPYKLPTYLSCQDIFPGVY
jgi:hypothetical protein